MTQEQLKAVIAGVETNFPVTFTFDILGEEFNFVKLGIKGCKRKIYFFLEDNRSEIEMKHIIYENLRTILLLCFNDSLI